MAETSNDVRQTNENSNRFAWLIEAPGQQYLSARTRPWPSFTWTKDHNAALRFQSQEQADSTMEAIRGLEPGLFGFRDTLGPARAVEHGWLS